MARTPNDANPAAATEPAPRVEGWARVAWLLVALELVAVIVLVSRPAGPLPVHVHYLAPPVLGSLAVLVGAWGMLTIVRSRGRPSRGRVAGLVALGLVIATVSYPVPFPARREGRPSQVEFRLPLRGEWRVMWGGSEPSHNLMARARADRRFGFDFVRRVEGQAFTGDGTRLEDWHAFGKLVHAPAPGRVARVVDGLPDRPPLDATAPGDEWGNLVVLEVADGEFLVLANLRSGSVRVAPGDQVEVGQLLAQVGRSGGVRYTSEPHLALHLQAGDDPVWAQGIPLLFHGLALDGEPVQRAQPRGRELSGGAGSLGQRVQHIGH